MRAISPHLIKFTVYILSGCFAAVVDFGAYFALLYLEVWYVLASIVGGVLGFVTAFVMHKFIVFQKTDNFMKHLKRYFIVDMVNTVVVTGLLYLLVDIGSVEAGPAKFIAIAPMVLWNFFIYKFVVYV